MATTPTTDATFEQDVLNSDVPVLVDFWATRCGPCRAVAPVLEELSGQYEGKLKIVKLDTDANPQTTGRYGITSIPSMYVFRGGEVVKTIVGALPKPKIVKELEPFIG
ncbi:thioredoxin [Janibacter limosus]|uniref:Thioredoxin n=1 Tax=Janibacter limosus TaxID=53458 RepID=A0AC61U4D1_9MICO|nr:thioredoxin [Janibacter limosus]UUZ44848.1 thioredoxin [Janibacter limosus]